MEQKDFLKRQIDEAGRVLAKALSGLTGGKDPGKVREGIANAEETLKSELDLDLDTFTDIPSEKFMEVINQNEALPEAMYEEFADTLVELAKNYQQSGEQDTARNLFQKALTLYEYLEESGSTFSFGRHAKMENIKQSL